MDGDRSNLARARIAWLSFDRESHARAAPQFEKAGYALCDDRDGAVGADLAVVDFRARRVTANAAARLAALARRRSADCGLVYLAPPFLGAAARAHLRRSGELVLVEEDLRPAVEACRRRLRLRNVAEETGERLKSLAALTRLSDFPPIEASSAPPSVLVAGGPGPVVLSALKAAEEVADRAVGVLTAGQAIRALETGAFDCAVFAPAREGDPLVGLARAMRRHRLFKDVPVLLAAVDEGLRARLAPLWGADALFAEHLGDELPARLLVTTRRARLAAAMRRFLEACTGDGVRDRLSGAFTPSFFGQHAARVFERGAQTGRMDSLVALRLGASEGAPAKIALMEAARLVNRVTRAEDCVARLSPDTLVALLSATTGADAEAAARRMEGVIANTMFQRAGAPFAVAAAAAAVERAPGAGLEETIAAVLARLNAAAPKTAPARPISGAPR